MCLHCTIPVLDNGIAAEDVTDIVRHPHWPETDSTAGHSNRHVVVEVLGKRADRCRSILVQREEKIAAVGHEILEEGLAAVREIPGECLVEGNEILEWHDFRRDCGWAADSLGFLAVPCSGGGCVLLLGHPSCLPYS